MKLEKETVNMITFNMAEPLISIFKDYIDDRSDYIKILAC